MRIAIPAAMAWAAVSLLVVAARADEGSVPAAPARPSATQPATQAAAGLPAAGRDSRLAQVKLAVGMSRLEAERLIAQATGVKSKYDLYAMDTSSEVRYSDGTVILIVRYKPGSPAPTIQLPDGSRQGYPPMDGDVLSWEFAAAGTPATPASGAAGDGEGLRLQAVLAAGAPAEFLPGQAIPFEVELINPSRTREYTVVKPGDGSESGWREPHVYYAAERFAPEGRWTPLAPAPIDRCKLFDRQWQKDVVTLKPGESLALKEWRPSPSSVFEFQQAGRYRIRVHYAYRGGQAHKGAASRPAEDLGGMKGVEPFEIVSDPVEISVNRPLNVTLKVRGNLIANQPARLSDLLEIAVSNDSDKPISAGQPTLSAEGRLMLQMIAPLGWGPTLDKQDNPHAARMDLQPGRSAPLLGAGEFANGLDGSWTYPRAGTVKLRAGYTPSTWKDVGTVWSDWVDVKVEPAKTPSPSPSPALQNRGL